MCKAHRGSQQNDLSVFRNSDKAPVRRPQSFSSTLLSTPVAMGDSESLFSCEASSPKVQLRSHSSTCRIGNVLILNQDSKGIFKQISSGWRRHFTLVAGGLSSVCVVVDPPRAGAKNVSDSSASADVQSVSNEVLMRKNGEGRGTPQQRTRCSCNASTGFCTESPQCCNNAKCSLPPNDSESCLAVSADASKQPNPRTTGRQDPNVTISKASCVPRAGVERRSDTEFKDRPPTQTLLHLGNSGVESSSQLCLPRSSQDCCSVSAYAAQAKSYLNSASPSPRIVHISVGSSQTLACDDAGSVYSWEDSQCTSDPGRGQKQKVLRPLLALGSRRVASVCAGDRYSLAVTDKGDVYSWGTSYSGQLGRLVEEVAPAPRYVAILMRTFITGVSCNETHVIANSQRGDCFSWGSNDCGQLGLGARSSPQAHPQRIPFRAKTAPQLHGQRSPSTVRRQYEDYKRVYPRNALLEKSQQRPASSTEGEFQALPCQSSVAAPDLEFCDELHKTEADYSPAEGAAACCETHEAFTFIVAVAAGWRHSLALTANGDVYSWGLNTAGQLGLGHCQACYTPVLVQDYENGVQVLRRRDFSSKDHVRKDPGGGSACTVVAEEAVYDDCSRCHCEGQRCPRCVAGRMCSIRRHRAAQSRKFERHHGEDGDSNSFAEDHGVSSYSWGGTDSQQRSTAGAYNGMRVAQVEYNGKEDTRKLLRATDSDSQSPHISTFGVIRNRVQGTRNASLSEHVCHHEDIKFQDPGVLNNLGNEFTMRRTISQICAGQLFSAFLSSDGHVFLAGRSPSAKQAAECTPLVDRTQRKYGPGTGGTPRSLIPAPVPGLEDVAVTEIACSKSALVAFVPCQVLRVHPSLVPLPSPKGPSTNLRVTITVLPDTFPSCLPWEPKADGLSEGAIVDHNGNVNTQAARAAERDSGLVGEECFSFCPDSHYSAAFAEGHPAEPPPHERHAKEVEVREASIPEITAEEGANGLAASAPEHKVLGSKALAHGERQVFEASRTLLDCAVSNRNMQVQEFEEREVLVRFRSLVPRLVGAFLNPRNSALVKGHFLKRVAEEHVAVAEIDCTCPTLFHCSTDNTSAFEKDCANLPRYRSGVSRRHEDAGTSPSLVLGGFGADSRSVGLDILGGLQSHDTLLPEANYFQPETPREEAAVRAYHETECLLQSQEVQVLPYAVEVSVDGGCCWSNADFNKGAASVLFARFPEAILSVCPNNVTTKGGLTLSIFLDYIPSGIPQENIVVKFTCIHKYQNAVFRNSRALHLERKPPSYPSSSLHTSAAAFSEQDPSHSKQIDENAGKLAFDTEATQQGCDWRQPFRQVALGGQAETDAGTGRETEAEEKLETAAPYEGFKGRKHLSEGLPTSAGEGSVAQASCAPAMLPCGTRNEGQDLSYYVLVPARVVTEKYVSEISPPTSIQKLALQCSSPALDGSIAAEFNLFLDVALNGVNFTGKPLPVDVVEAEIVELIPNVGYSRRDTKVYIRASEHCDSSETVVLLKHDDGYQEIVPVSTEAETRQLYFFMPQRRSLTPPPPAEDAPSVSEFNEGCTDKSDSSGKLLVEGTTRTDCKGNAASGLPVKCPTTELRSFPISVHLSFNGQAFGNSGEVFLHYDTEPVVVGVLAYTIGEGGELFEADLESVIAPGTTVVVSVQSALATHSSQARLTILRSSVPCQYALLAQPTPMGVCDTDITAAQQEGNVAPPPEAVERVIYLPAALDMEPHRLVLQPDHTRGKKKSPPLRGALADNGLKGKPAAGSAASNSGTGSVGSTVASKRNAGGAVNPSGSGAGAENSAASSRVKNKAVAGIPGPPVPATSGAPSTVTGPGNKAANKKHEKPGEQNNHADAEEEKSNGPTLTVTIPAITLDPQQSDPSAADGVLFALAEISLDGQHFVPIKQCPLLRLQCSRAVSAEVTCASRPISATGARSSNQGKAT